MPELDSVSVVKKINERTGVIAIGDSITAEASAGSWFASTILKTNSRYLKIYNAGVGGNTTQQMIDRFQTDVADRESDEIWIHAGTNDLGVTSTVNFKTKFSQLVDLAKATGRLIRVIAIPPKSTSLTQSEEYRLVQMIVAKEKKVYYHDIWVDSVDLTTGGFKSGYSVDGTHPDTIAIDLATERMILNLATSKTHNSFLPMKNALGLGLLSNPLLLVDTNADGVADGVTKGGGGSPAFTLVPADFGNAQKSVVTATTSDGSINFNSINAIDGHKYKIVCVAEFVSGVGCYAQMLVQFRNNFTNITNNIVLNTRGTFKGEIDYDFVFSSAGGANKIFIQFGQNPLGGSHPANTSELRLSQIQVYDLTAIGIA